MSSLSKDQRNSHGSAWGSADLDQKLFFDFKRWVLGELTYVEDKVADKMNWISRRIALLVTSLILLGFGALLLVMGGIMRISEIARQPDWLVAIVSGVVLMFLAALVLFGVVRKLRHRHH